MLHEQAIPSCSPTLRCVRQKNSRLRSPEGKILAVSVIRELQSVRGGKVYPITVYSGLHFVSKHRVNTVSTRMTDRNTRQEHVLLQCCAFFCPQNIFDMSWFAYNSSCMHCCWSYNASHHQALPGNCLLQISNIVAHHNATASSEKTNMCSTWNYSEKIRTSRKMLERSILVNMPMKIQKSHLTHNLIFYRNGGD